MARIFLIAGAVLIGFGLIFGGIQVKQRHDAAVERQQVDQYTAGILPEARLAGRLVSETIVPMLVGYRAGSVSSATVAQSAVGWHLFFQRTREAFRKVAHPGKVGPIADDFDRALSEYAQAVADFEQVGTPQAAAAVQSGAKEAQRADLDYAKAAGLLGCLRSATGLSALREFPPARSCPPG